MIENYIINFENIIYKILFISFISILILIVILLVISLLLLILGCLIKSQKIKSKFLKIVPLLTIGIIFLLSLPYIYILIKMNIYNVFK